LSFDSFTDFIAMGGHAGYVWPAYGLGLVVLAALVLAPIRARRRFFAVEGERVRRDGAARREANRDGHGISNASDST